MTQSRTNKVLALSLGAFLTQLVGVISGIVLARVLTKDDLATYRQTMLAYSFASPFLTLALPSALYFFLPRRPGSERSVLLSNLVPLGIMGIVFCGFLLLGGARLLAWRFNNPALQQTLHLLALYPLFALPMAALEACLVARNQINRLTVFNILSRLLLTAALILVCLWTKRPEALVLTQVVLAGIMMVPAVTLMWQSCKAGSAKPDFGLMWEMTKYSVPLGLATMLGTMTLQLASVIVSALCTPAEFAVYSVGAFELPLVGIVTGSIATVILADMSRLCQEGRKDEALRVFRTAALRAAAILLPTTVFFQVIASPFIEAMYSAAYLDSVTPFRLYLLILPMRIINYGAALMALGLTRVILFRSLLDLLLNALFCALFVWLWGYLGAAVALVLTLYVWTTPYNLSRIAKGFGVRGWNVFPLKSLGKVLLISLVAAPLPVLCLAFDTPHRLMQMSIAALLYWPAVALLMWRQGLLPPLATIFRTPRVLTTGPDSAGTS